MKYCFLFITIAIGVCVPHITSAANILTGTEIHVPVETVYTENVYVGAGKTIIEGDISEDLVVIGGEVFVQGEVTGDIFLLGGEVHFSGVVAGDLRVIGGQIRVEGTIRGDVLAVGGEVLILPTAVIEKEIFAVGGYVSVANDFAGELKIVAANTAVIGTVSGSAEVTSQYIYINSETVISGDFLYYAPQRLNQDAGAIITGEVRFNEISELRDTNFVKKALLSFISFWFLLRFITTLIIAFVLVYVFKVFSQGVSHIVLHSFWKSLAIGCLVVIGAPLIITVFLISLVALPIGFLFAIALISMGIIAPAMTGIYVGSWLQQYIHKEKDREINFHGAVIGVVFLTLMQFVPYVGGWIIFVLTIASVGAMIRHIRLSIIH